MENLYASGSGASSDCRDAVEVGIKTVTALRGQHDLLERVCFIRTDVAMLRMAVAELTSSLQRGLSALEECMRLNRSAMSEPRDTHDLSG